MSDDLDSVKDQSENISLERIRTTQGYGQLCQIDRTSEELLNMNIIMSEGEDIPVHDFRQILETFNDFVQQFPRSQRSEVYQQLILDNNIKASTRNAIPKTFLGCDFMLRLMDCPNIINPEF